MRKFFSIFMVLVLAAFFSSTLFAQSSTDFSKICSTFGIYGTGNLYTVELLDQQSGRKSQRCIADDWVITGGTSVIDSIEKGPQQVTFTRLAEGGINVRAKSGDQLTDDNYLFIKIDVGAKPADSKPTDSELIEDTEIISDTQPRWLLNGLSVHPRLWRDRADATSKILKFTMKVQYQGPDYDFSELSANNVASLVCDFGVNARTGDSVYRSQENFVYTGALPLADDQEITANILVKLPGKHKKLLTKKNNFCSVQLNNVIDGGDLTAEERNTIIDGVSRDSAPFNYKVRMARNKLQLTPRWGDE